MHQLNVFQVLVSLTLLVQKANQTDSFGILGGWDFTAVVFWLLCVGRGFLCSLIIKVFDSVVKGLADVAAMVGVFALQITFDQKPVDGPIAGLQVVLLLSVLCFFVGRQMAAELTSARDVAKRAIVRSESGDGLDKHIKSDTSTSSTSASSKTRP